MTEKKTRASIPKINKVRAELQREVGSACPFCDNSEVGHFEIHHIDENPSNNDMGNLLLLCPTCHSKITKGDISQIIVFKKKIELMKIPLSTPPGQRVVNFNGRAENTVVGDNNRISIKQAKKIVKQKYPEGCIGFDSKKADYIAYLIEKYNKYKSYDVRGKMNYAVFSKQLKNQYKIPPQRTIYNLSIERFNELSDYIQTRIKGTKLMRQKGPAHKSYRTFPEYLEKYRPS